MLPLACILSLLGQAPLAAGAPDSDAPLIEDVAAAAGNATTAPVVTVMMSDRGSGVGDAAVLVRASRADPWQRVPLQGDGGGGGSSLFIARLPDGLQRTGFQYYVEASDRAGNGPARIGSADEPIVVEPAGEGTRARLERDAQAQALAEAPAGIHPAFIMLGFGVGILAGAGAAGYGIDLAISSRRLERTEKELGSDATTEERRNNLTIIRRNYQDAVFYDTTLTVLLGVVSVAGLVTGTALLVATNLE